MPHELQCYGQTQLRPQHNNEARAAFRRRMDATIRNAFLHVMASLFGKVKDCIEFQLDPAIFDVEQFLRVSSPEDA